MAMHPLSLRRVLGIVPAIGVSMAPKLICPLCWPAYAAVLGVLGLGFLAQTRYLLALNLGFLVFSEFWLLFRAKAGKGYGPACVGFAAAAAVLAGKFVLNSNPVLWIGILMLLAASIWHSWPSQRAASCSDGCKGSSGIRN